MFKVGARAFTVFPELLKVFLEFVFGVFQGVINNADVVQFPLVVHVIFQLRIFALIAMGGSALGDVFGKR